METEATTATITVFHRESDDRWIMSFVHGPMVEHIDLNKEAGRPIATAEVANKFAHFWLFAQGVLRVPCPYCYAERGKRCTRAPGAFRDQPHKARLALVGLEGGFDAEP